MTRICVAVCCLVMLAAVACGGGSPSSPSSAGATITGTVSTTAGASAAPSSSAGLTVGVSGTTLSTGVESGSFRLGGVPPGDVQLTFRGAGANSTVSVANVADQEVIELQVMIAGGTATVLNELRGGQDKILICHRTDTNMTRSS